MYQLVYITPIFILAFFVFSVTKVSAKILSNQNGDVSVAKSQIINDDLFVRAQTAEIDGTVNGDVFIGAQTIKITGIINGNLHMGANTIYLGGTTKGNVYAGAQSMLVSGANIGGSLLAGAATANIDKSSTIGGSIIVGAGTLSIDTQIKRSVYAGTGSLTIGSDAKIGGDLFYAANKNGQTNISSDAKITGTIYNSQINIATKNADMDVAKKQVSKVFDAFKFGLTIVFFISALIIGFLYMRFFGKHFAATSEIISKSFLKSLGVGFLVTISFIPGLIILLITIVGIPLAAVAFLMFLLYWYMAKIVVGLALGNYMSNKFKWKVSNYGTFAIGLLVIYILKMIPVIGFFTGLVVFWVGLGALTLQTFSPTSSK